MFMSEKETEVPFQLSRVGKDLSRFAHEVHSTVLFLPDNVNLSYYLLLFFPGTNLERCFTTLTIPTSNVPSPLMSLCLSVVRAGLGVGKSIEETLMTPWESK